MIQGLKHLHKMGRAHLDLHFGNVLIDFELVPKQFRFFETTFLERTHKTEFELLEKVKEDVKCSGIKESAHRYYVAKPCNLYLTDFGRSYVFASGMLSFNDMFLI